MKVHVSWVVFTLIAGVLLGAGAVYLFFVNLLGHAWGPPS